MDYNFNFEKELAKVEQIAGRQPDIYVAHAYLKKMRNTLYQRSQILNGTLGKYMYKALTELALTTVPSIQELQVVRPTPSSAPACCRFRRRSRAAA